MLCVSELPIDSTTRVSGQATTVQDPTFQHNLFQFAEKLNLKEHLCTIYQIQSRFSIDTEGKVTVNFQVEKIKDINQVMDGII